jgi:hypothetical protein
MSSRGHSAKLVVASQGSRREFVNAGVCAEERILVLNPPDIAFDRTELIDECLKRELQYGETLSLLISERRSLGKGYYFNVEQHPEVASAWKSHDEKKLEILQEMLAWEQILDQEKPELVIDVTSNHILRVITRTRQIPHFSLIAARMGDRYIWCDTEFWQSSHLHQAIGQYMAEAIKDGKIEYKEYVKDAGASPLLDLSRYERKACLASSFRYLTKQTKKWVRTFSLNAVKRCLGKKVSVPDWKKSYSLFGWLPSMITCPSNLNFLRKNGKHPDQLAGRRLIYVPLHMEPEIALHQLSPEYCNVMEMITQVSKAVPADCLLVIREHPLSFGVRGQMFYRNLLRMANVVIAYPDIDSWTWVRASKVTAAITGTVGYEAVYFKKPVISFGRHQLINHLPTVRHSLCLRGLRHNINELLNINENDPLFSQAREALWRTTTHYSVELKGFGLDYKNSLAPKEYLANKAIDLLFNRYWPNLKLPQPKFLYPIEEAV